MSEFETITPLRIQTGIPVTIIDVALDKVRNEVVVTLANDEGAELVDRFALGGEWAEVNKKKMEKVKKILGISSLKDEGKGKRIGIHIDVNSFVYARGPKAGKSGISSRVAGYFSVTAPKTDDSASGDDINF